MSQTVSTAEHWRRRSAPATTEFNHIGMVSLILGVIGLVCWPAAAGAVVVGGIALHRVRKKRATNRRQAVAGLVLGIVGVLICAGVASAFLIGSIVKWDM